MDGLILSGAREFRRSVLLDRAARAASGFASLGIGENGAVALALRNDLAFFEAAMGASLVGAYAVPVNWHFKADEAGYILQDCGARVVVVHADLLPQIRAVIPAGVSVFVVPTPPEIREAHGIPTAAGAPPKGAAVWDDWAATHAPWTEPPRPARTSMIYTSGTTGRPKGVRRQPATPEMQAAMTRMVSRIFVPDEEYGESLAAHIEPEDGMTLTANSVRAHLRPRIAGYKVPKLFEFQRGLPREDSGKIFKRKLRAPYWEKAGRQI